MADYKRYLEKKAKGLADMVAINDAFAISFSKFNAETGEAENPEIQAISREDLQKDKQALLEQMAEIDGILLEMDALAGVQAGEVE